MRVLYFNIYSKILNSRRSNFFILVFNAGLGSRSARSRMIWSEPEHFIFSSGAGAGAGSL